ELDLHDISLLDAEFGKMLQALVCLKQYLESILDRNEILNLRFRGTPVEDLCLDFTLPGYLDYVLNNGDDNVDLNNLDECISMVVDATVKTGITRQMEAFRAGFNQTFLPVTKPYGKETAIRDGFFILSFRLEIRFATGGGGDKEGAARVWGEEEEDKNENE
ncbi:E3 ubiquitin protein ligase UPL3, partial [Tanacetum coccineum]